METNPKTGKIEVSDRDFFLANLDQQTEREPPLECPWSKGQHFVILIDERAYRCIGVFASSSDLEADLKVLRAQLPQNIKVLALVPCADQKTAIKVAGEICRRMKGKKVPGREEWFYPSIKYRNFLEELVAKTERDWLDFANTLTDLAEWREAFK